MSDIVNSIEFERLIDVKAIGYEEYLPFIGSGSRVVDAYPLYDNVVLLQIADDDYILKLSVVDFDENAPTLIAQHTEPGGHFAILNVKKTSDNIYSIYAFGDYNWNAPHQLIVLEFDITSGSINRNTNKTVAINSSDESTTDIVGHTMYCESPNHNRQPLVDSDGNIYININSSKSNMLLKFNSDISGYEIIPVIDYNYLSYYSSGNYAVFGEYDRSYAAIVNDKVISSIFNGDNYKPEGILNVFDLKDPNNKSTLILFADIIKKAIDENGNSVYDVLTANGQITNPLFYFESFAHSIYNLYNGSILLSIKVVYKYYDSDYNNELQQDYMYYHGKTNISGQNDGREYSEVFNFIISDIVDVNSISVELITNNYYTGGWYGAYTLKSLPGSTSNTSKIVRYNDDDQSSSIFFYEKYKNKDTSLYERVDNIVYSGNTQDTQAYIKKAVGIETQDRIILFESNYGTNMYIAKYSEPLKSIIELDLVTNNGRPKHYSVLYGSGNDYAFDWYDPNSFQDVKSVISMYPLFDDFFVASLGRSSGTTSVYILNAGADLNNKISEWTSIFEGDGAIIIDAYESSDNVYSFILFTYSNNKYEIQKYEYDHSGPSMNRIKTVNITNDQLVTSSIRDDIIYSRNRIWNKVLLGCDNYAFYPTGNEGSLLKIDKETLSYSIFEITKSSLNNSSITSGLSTNENINPPIDFACAGNKIIVPVQPINTNKRNQNILFFDPDSENIVKNVYFSDAIYNSGMIDNNKIENILVGDIYGRIFSVIDKNTIAIDFEYISIYYDKGNCLSCGECLQSGYEIDNGERCMADISGTLIVGNINNINNLSFSYAYFCSGCDLSSVYTNMSSNYKDINVSINFDYDDEDSSLIVNKTKSNNNQDDDLIVTFNNNQISWLPLPYSDIPYIQPIATKDKIIILGENNDKISYLKYNIITPQNINASADDITITNYNLTLQEPESTAPDDNIAQLLRDHPLLPNEVNIIELINENDSQLEDITPHDTIILLPGSLDDIDKIIEQHISHKKIIGGTSVDREETVDKVLE